MSTHSDESTGRRRPLPFVCLLIGAAAAVFAISSLPRHSAGSPVTEVSTLPLADLFFRATANTEADTDYAADATFTTASLRVSHRVVVQGARIMNLGTVNGAPTEYRIEEGRYYLRSVDEWIESVLPAGRDYDILAAVKKVLPALRAGTSEEILRDNEIATFRGTCEPGSVVRRLGWLCDRGSLLTIAVDLETERITTFEANGMMPLFPGRWEQGQFMIAFDTTTRTEIAPLGKIDTSKIECLARTLDMPVDRPALAERLRDTTTQYNNMLFSGCGYRSFPPGADLGVT